jgi:hypothetical protein
MNKPQKSHENAEFRCQVTKSNQEMSSQRDDNFLLTQQLSNWTRGLYVIHLHLRVISTNMIQLHQGDQRRRVLILGAAERDFHNFNVLFRDGDTGVEVVGFTATQIPKIDGRKYPASLSGK